MVSFYNEKVSKRKKIINGFIVLSILLGTASGIMQLVIPLYAIGLNATDAQVGLTRGILQFGGLLVSLPAGFLVDRFGSKKINILGGIVDIILILTIPKAINFKILIIILFVEGMISNIRWTALNTTFFEQLKYIGNSKAGWARAASSIGLNFIGPLIVGELIGKNSYLFIFELVGFFNFLAISMWFTEKYDYKKAGNLTEIEKYENIFFQLSQLIKNHKLLRTAIIQSIAVGCFTVFSVFIVVLLSNSFKYPPRIVSMVVSSQGIAFILVMFFGGKLMHKFKLYVLYLLAFTLELVGLIAPAFSNSLLLIWGGTIILGIGVGLNTSISYSILGDMKGDKGKITGLFYFFTGTGMAVAPFLSSYVISIFGIRAAFILFIPIEVIVLIYFLCQRYKNYYNLKLKDDMKEINLILKAGKESAKESEYNE